MSDMLITEQYRAEQAALHAKGNYGTAALHYGGVVAQLLDSTGARSLLDYGCGSRRSLLQALKLPDDVVYEGYDPAVPDYSRAPMPAELVTCIDVLEHIEPNLLDNVLDNLAELCDPYGFFTVHTGPAQKVLTDGRNAHLTQEGQDWWLPRFKQRFEVLSLQSIPSGFALVVRALQSDTKLPLPSAVTGLPAVAPRQGQTTSPKDADQQTQSAQMVLKHLGHRIVFNTPNPMTAWRVKSLFDKEPDTIRWISEMVSGSTLIDIGANVGMYSVFSAITRNVKVYAFEPESQNYALLNANIAANALSERVVAFPLALSDEMKLDKLYLSDFSAGGSCHSFAEQVGFDLKPRNAAFAQGAFSVTLDQLVASGAVPVPDYVKIDVDGIEHKVIDGAKATLANPKVKGLLIELNTKLTEHRAVVDRIVALGFVYDEGQVQGALRKKGAFEGVGEFVFRRADQKQVVDFNKQYHIAPPLHSQGRAVMHHVLRQVEKATVTEQPFPYLVVDDVFPADYYAQMLEHFPTKESLRPIAETGRVMENMYKERLVVLFTDEEFARMNAPQQRFWRDFAQWMYADQFLSYFVHRFQPYLEPRLAKIIAADNSLYVKGDALLVNDRTDYAIGPHTDSPRRLVTFLFYLPRDMSMRELGTSVYRPKDPSFVCWGGPHHDYDKFDKVATVEFLPNRLLAFPKTERSFHGVEPIKRPNVDRPLLINNVRVLNKTTH
jgi:FkbM family methyltransferase